MKSQELTFTKLINVRKLLLSRRLSFLAVSLGLGLLLQGVSIVGKLSSNDCSAHLLHWEVELEPDLSLFRSFLFLGLILKLIPSLHGVTILQLLHRDLDTTKRASYNEK